VTKKPRPKPRFATSSEPLRFVVEGVGDVVRRSYAPAFQKLLEHLRGTREVEVVFADRGEFWRPGGDPRLVQKMTEIIQSVKGWGGRYLDKSDPADLSQYRALRPDVVIVATPDFTHVDVAREWLTRVEPPEQIFLEKPLAESVRAARRLLGMVRPDDHGILAFDHYRARLLPSRTQLKTVLRFLGRGPWALRFYFLEDHSAADPNYPAARDVGRDGAIENEQRVGTLKNGLVLDAMPHLIAVLATFGRVETFRPTRICAGQYTGVDGDPDRRTEIARETFAEVRFLCANHAGERIDGQAYVGKGVRGVKSLGPAFDHNVKVLEIESGSPGLEGNTVRFDMKSSTGVARAYLLSKGGRTELEFPLYESPYQVFLEKVADGTYREADLALPVEAGKSILVALEDVCEAIQEKGALPTYPSGVANLRTSLYLDEVQRELGGPLWGR
jgi:hypothetical protein